MRDCSEKGEKMVSPLVVVEGLSWFELSVLFQLPKKEFKRLPG